MPKTKSQAQKNQEREERIQQENEKRRQEREAHAAALKEKYEQSQKEAATEPLSKKERLKQKKAARKQAKETGQDDDNNEDTVAQPFAARSTETDDVDETEQALQAAVEREKNAASSTAKHVRVVQNHSTYCAGLRPVLVRLEKIMPDCTIIPGEISQVSSHLEKFELRFQRMKDANTYKFVARCGHTTQDVLISVPDKNVLTQEVIEEYIADVLKEKEDNNSVHLDETQDDLSTVALSSYNRGVAEARNNFWREKHQSEHKKAEDQQRALKQQQLVEQQKRTLANKGISKDSIDEYATRDVNIITGKERSKRSMR